jgi:hypothetical protein
MTSVPPQTSGVAGAMLQVCLQLGAVVGLSIQAGLFTVKPGNVENEVNVQISYWFEAGWCVLNFLLVVVLFRTHKGHEQKRKTEDMVGQTQQVYVVDGVDAQYGTENDERNMSILV